MQKKLQRILPVFLSGGWIIFQLYTTADSWLAIFMLFWFYVIVFFCVASIITYVKDFRMYYATKSWRSFLPTITSFLFIALFIITNYFLAARDFSPIIIKATRQENFGDFTIAFREDGTYKLSIGGLGESNYRGTYRLDNNVIVLDKSVDSNIISRILVIRNMITLDYTKSINDVGIYQVNDKYQIIDKDHPLTINEDHRDKM